MVTGTGARLTGSANVEVCERAGGGNARGVGAASLRARGAVQGVRVGGSHGSGTAGKGINPTTSFSDTSHHSHARTAAGNEGTARHTPHTTPAMIAAST